MSAHCQEGASPSRAKALRARNQLLLRRREAGWGAQKRRIQSVRKELDSAGCLDVLASDWRSPTPLYGDGPATVWVAVKVGRMGHQVVGDGTDSEGSVTSAWGDLWYPGEGRQESESS